MNDQYAKEVIDPGDMASQMAKKVCFESHCNSSALIVVPHQPENFRGAVGWAWQKHLLKKLAQYEVDRKTGQVTFWTMLEEAENDGAGGKPQFHTLLGLPVFFAGLGWEIICMVADDFARTGRFPCIIDNAIDTKYITEKNFPFFKAMMLGYGEALKQAALVNITGEIAIMKHSVTAFCDDDTDAQLILTWGASCLGLAHRNLLIDGSTIDPYMPVVGFWEPGYRCNGGTFFINLIMQLFGPEIDKIRRNPEAMEFVRQLTVPSQSYARTVCRILGWKPDGKTRKPLAQVKGIAHITGGGMAKFREILPAGVGAYLNNMPMPADVLLQAQKLSWDTDLRLTDLQAHTTLHGGCGMMLVCSNMSSAKKVIMEAAKDGIRAQVVGKTEPSDKRHVVIDSQFKEGGKTLIR